MNSDNNQPSQEIKSTFTLIDKQITSMEQRSKSSKTMKLDQQTKQQIIDDINALNASLVDMSKVCLKKIDEMAKKLPNVETQINEMDGILDFVKEATGSALLGSYATDNKNEGSEHHNYQINNSVVLNPPKQQEFTFPSDEYTINMDVLSNVGRQVGEPNSRQQLIIATEPDEISKRNKIWSMQGDFFKSPKANLKSQTSFGILYT